MKKLLISFFTLSLGCVSLQVSAFNYLQAPAMQKTIRKEYIKNNPIEKQKILETFLFKYDFSQEDKALLERAFTYNLENENCQNLPDFNLTREEAALLHMISKTNIKTLDQLIDAEKDSYTFFSRHNQNNTAQTHLKRLNRLIENRNILCTIYNLQPFPSRQECENQKAFLAEKKAELEAQAQS